MLFLHNRNIVTIGQLTHYQPNHYNNIYNVLPLIRCSHDISYVVNIEPGIFQDPSHVGSYQGDPPITLPIMSSQVCCVTLDGLEIPDEPPLDEHATLIILENSLSQLGTEKMLGSLPPIWKIFPQDLSHIPFLYPPPSISCYQVTATLTLPNMVITIPVWYLK